jgi:serine/threonine-protein kinase PRP4
MTDITSGSKRPYEGDRNGVWKRRREDDEDRSRPRDWREVHLKTDHHKDSARDRDRDRSGRSGYRRSEDYYRRDSRDREKDKDRERDRDRERDHRRSHRRRSHSRNDDRRSSYRTQANGSSKDRESDMEEGEYVSTFFFSFTFHQTPTYPLHSRISPRRDHSRARSSSYTSTPRRPDHDSDIPRPPEEPPSAQSQPSKQEPKPDPELELAVPEEEPSLEEQMAARRARRAAILAKYSVNASSTSLPQQSSPRDITPSTSVQPLVQDLTIEDRNGHHKRPSLDHEADAVHHIQTASRSASPASQPNGEDDFSLTKEGAEEESAVEAGARVPSEGEQVSAADYDPSLDRREDEQRRARGLGAKVEPQEDAIDIIEEVTEEEDEDVDDMFAIITSEPNTKKKVRVSTVCHFAVFNERQLIFFL